MLRVFTTSDIHTDYEENLKKLMLLVQNTLGLEGLFNVLILAGDVTDKTKLLIATFEALTPYFDLICFVPGNHDVWVLADEAGRKFTTIDKYRDILIQASQHGVAVGPVTLTLSVQEISDGETHKRPLLKPLLLAPLHGWHHESFDWESEIPDSSIVGGRLPSIREVVSDRRKTVWPESSEMREYISEHSHCDKVVHLNHISCCQASENGEQSATAWRRKLCQEFGIGPQRRSCPTEDEEWSQLVARRMDLFNFERLASFPSKTVSKTLGETTYILDVKDAFNEFQVLLCDKGCCELSPSDLSGESVSAGSCALDAAVPGEGRFEENVVSSEPNTDRSGGDPCVSVNDARRLYSEVISYSHFLPFPFLNPEKRYLFYPPLAKVVGSNFIGERLLQIRSTLHVFGHTHFGWNATTMDLIRAQGKTPKPLNPNPYGHTQNFPLVTAKETETGSSSECTNAERVLSTEAENNSFLRQQSMHGFRALPSLTAQACLDGISEDGSTASDEGGKWKDCPIRNTRFVQAPLGYPRERAQRARSLSVGSFLQKKFCDSEASPASIGLPRNLDDPTSDGNLHCALIVAANGISHFSQAPAHWSSYYCQNRRDGTNTNLASYVKEAHARFLK